MSAPKPSMGRIVHYTLTEIDANAINKRRTDFALHRRSEGYADTGFVAHHGNDARAGDAFPAVIVRAHSDGSTNLKVLLDGSDDLWAPSRPEGEGQGRWIWPPRV